MAAAARGLIFIVCALLLVSGLFGKTFSEAERYGYLTDIMPGDWAATNVWLDSTDCTLARGTWLALCEDGKLVPIGERALADDPGHALLLDAWSAATGRRATLADVARLNTILNTLGLITLAGLLVALRNWGAAAALLVLGPAEYLFWMGTSPHWSYIGMVSLAAVLPLALLARAERLLGRRAAAAWIAAGLVFLACVALVRESIGIMGLLISLAALCWSGVKAPRSLTKIAGLLVVASLSFVAFTAPRLAVKARDASFDMAAAERLERHGLSHTLYLGLGFVENKFGLIYDDDFGYESARKIVPDIVPLSHEYFRLMWTLYLGRVAQDPLEVARIYAVKTGLMLERPTIYPGPPLGVVVAIAVLHFLVLTAFGWWRRIGFSQGLVVEAVSLAFLGLFIAQGMVALPSHMYVVPANAFVLVLAGVIAESILRALLSCSSLVLRRGMRS
ncbi:MAG: hypothetical protein EXR12_09010 [Rhodospirillaceae bacterium]|nr:hypothetical protein [Rhodospirillaceae bacterium]